MVHYHGVLLGPRLGKCPASAPGMFSSQFDRIFRSMNLSEGETASMKTQNEIPLIKTLFRTQSVAQLQDNVAAAHSRANSTALKRTLGVWDLTSLGVAAIVGAGIFSTIGNAVSTGGPAVVFLFLFTAIACAFSALCYAEFASAIPVAGSAYTYAYVAFGEIFAWIIGWDLLMEYAISNIAVAISWSEYFANFLAGYGLRIPTYFCTDFLTAHRAHQQVEQSLMQGKSLATLIATDPNLVRYYQAWIDAPQIAGLRTILNLPALGVTFLVTWIAYLGIQESKRTSNILVVIKVLVILMVIGLGAFYVHPENWVPFAPHGFNGVFQGASAVFFAYIGFDALSTTAEECKNPQKDLPKGMFMALGICTLLYVLVTLILTGMVPFNKLGVGDPLAYVFGPDGANLPWIAGLISASAVISLFTVLLVYQIGQPRIWMAMSRDGLLPPIFAAIHPRYKTPWFSTLLTGVLVAVPSLFMNLVEVTNLASIGTLFAFTLVCGGVLVLDTRLEKTERKFRIPYINSKWIFPGLFAACLILVGVLNLNTLTGSEGPAFFTLETHLPYAIFFVGMSLLSVLCFRKNLSLIPVLGLSTCFYLITELGLANWIRFGVWLLIGLSLYFVYGIKHSRLNLRTAQAPIIPS